MGMYDVPRCQHVKVNGTQCGSPALRRKRFCYFHDNYRQIKASLQEDESKVVIGNFPLLEDANSVQVALMHVIHLLGSGKMDTKVAGLMLYALQTAAGNLKRVNFEAEKATDVVIDQDTLDLTCINGPQWFDRDFQETEKKTSGEKAEAPAVAKPATKNKDKKEELPAGERTKLRKKPDPLTDTPDMSNSLAGILLQRMGLVPGDGENAHRDEPPRQMMAAD